MAKGINRAQLLGYVGKAPEVRVTAGGTTVASFSLATSERFKDGRGEWKDRSEWHSLVAFGRTAEIIRDYAGKGSKLLVDGRLQTRSWEKDGHKFYRTEIVVEDLMLLDGRKGESREPGDDRSDDPGYSAGYVAQHITDSEIPF